MKLPWPTKLCFRTNIFECVWLSSCIEHLGKGVSLPNVWKFMIQVFDQKSTTSWSPKHSGVKLWSKSIGSWCKPSFKCNSQFAITKIDLDLGPCPCFVNQIHIPLYLGPRCFYFEMLQEWVSMQSRGSTPLSSWTTRAIYKFLRFT